MTGNKVLSFLTSSGRRFDLRTESDYMKKKKKKKKKNGLILESDIRPPQNDE
jgi:hypothetical protein